MAYKNQYNTGDGSLRKMVLNKQVVLTRLSQFFFALALVSYFIAIYAIIDARRGHGGLDSIGNGAMFIFFFLFGNMFFFAHRVMKNELVS